MCVPLNRRAVLALALAGVLAARLAAPAETAQVDVIPYPKEVHFEPEEFAIDGATVLLVSEKATEGTRRAARAVQLGLREGLGLDVPIVRIAEQPKLGVTKAIWVVEPRLGRSPARTIGVEGLDFSDAMRAEGYFIRVDALEVVVHGASDAGSFYGAQTLLQLIRPGRKGSLLRRARPPSVPCLWLRDWPSQPLRAIPPSHPLDTRSLAPVDWLLELGAHYKLNALAKSLLPDDAGQAARVREGAAARAIRIVESPAPVPDSPLAVALGTALVDNRRMALAACAEAAWGPPDPDPKTFRRRFDLDVVRWPAPPRAPAPRPKAMLDLPDGNKGKGGR